MSERAVTGSVSEGAMTERQFAKFVERSLNRVRVWRYEGTAPPSYRIGKTVYYDRAQVDAWVAERKRAGMVDNAQRAARRGSGATRRPAG